MWADRSITQHICRPETESQQAAGGVSVRYHSLLPLGERGLGKLTLWGAPDSSRLSAWLAGLLGVE